MIWQREEECHSSLPMSGCSLSAPNQSLSPAPLVIVAVYQVGLGGDGRLFEIWNETLSSTSIYLICLEMTAHLLQKKPFRLSSRGASEREFSGAGYDIQERRIKPSTVSICVSFSFSSRYCQNTGRMWF